MKLVCTRIKPKEIRSGDEIAFDYARPNEHQPSRVGQVVSVLKTYVLLWDYSLYDGPGFRSYFYGDLLNLSRIEEGTTTQPAITIYEKAIRAFGRLFRVTQQPNPGETGQGGSPSDLR
jgi:hypothetical protein